MWVAAGDGAVRAYDPRSIRPTGPTASVPGANGLAVGSGGVWVSSGRAGTVTRVDPRTRRADAPIRVGHEDCVECERSIAAHQGAAV